MYFHVYPMYIYVLKYEIKYPILSYPILSYPIHFFQLKPIYLMIPNDVFELGSSRLL